MDLLPPGGFSSFNFDQAVLITHSAIQLIETQSTFCIDETVPCFLDVISFHSLDVAIFGV